MRDHEISTSVVPGHSSRQPANSLTDWVADCPRPFA